MVVEGAAVLVTVLDEGQVLHGRGCGAVTDDATGSAAGNDGAPAETVAAASAELDFARRHPSQYALYRVYDVLHEPRFFALEGDINDVLELTAMTYSAQIAAAKPASSP